MRPALYLAALADARFASRTVYVDFHFGGKRLREMFRFISNLVLFGDIASGNVTTMASIGFPKVSKKPNFHKEEKSVLFVGK